MNRFLGMGLVLALVVGLVVANARAEDKKKDEKKKILTIKEIMAKAHKGADSCLAKAAAAVKDGEWDDVSKIAKVMEALGTDLSQNKPKKGDAKSWKTKTGAWIKATKTLGEAAEKKDKKKAAGAVAYLKGACGACHKAHK